LENLTKVILVKYPDSFRPEEAESHENAPVENLADDDEIKRRKKSVSSRKQLPLSY